MYPSLAVLCLVGNGTCSFSFAFLFSSFCNPPLDRGERECVCVSLDAPIPIISFLGRRRRKDFIKKRICKCPLEQDAILLFKGRAAMTQYPLSLSLSLRIPPFSSSFGNSIHVAFSQHPPSPLLFGSSFLISCLYVRGWYYNYHQDRTRSSHRTKKERKKRAHILLPSTTNVLTKTRRKCRQTLPLLYSVHWSGPPVRSSFSSPGHIFWSHFTSPIPCKTMYILRTRSKLHVSVPVYGVLCTGYMALLCMCTYITPYTTYCVLCAWCACERVHARVRD